MKDRTPDADPGILPYVMVADAASAVDGVVAAGGTVVLPAATYGTETLATFLDPAGNLLGIYQQPGLAEMEATPPTAGDSSAVRINRLGVTDDEVERLVVHARDLTMDRRHDVYDDFIDNLLLCVLDFQMHSTAVNKALSIYRANRRPEIPDGEALQAIMDRYPDDQAGNTELAQFLWNNRHWTRVGMLRRLLPFFASVGVTDQETLVAWARVAEFRRDFQGRVKGLGFAVYQWLLMRCEVDTVKPDVHTRRYCEAHVGRVLTDNEVVDLIVRAAMNLGIPARSLDVAIWENQSGNVESDSRHP